MGTVVIVDDHPLIRVAIRALLENKGHTIKAEAGNGMDAIRLVRSHEPDLVVLDLDIPKLDGLSVMTHFKSNKLAAKILVLTAGEPTDFAARCLKAGAAGFVSKSAELNEVTDAVAALLSGLSYFPTCIINPQQQDSGHTKNTPSSPLTNREITVLRLLQKGIKNRDIASTLYISHKTVSTYKARLLKKFNVANLVDLVEVTRRESVRAGQAQPQLIELSN